jgi:hypothetical protein
MINKGEQYHGRDDEQWIEATEPNDHWESSREDRLQRDRIFLWKHDEGKERVSFGVGFRQSHEALVRARFNDLVGQWRKEIGYKSSLRKIVFNRAYLAIVLMAVDDDKHRKLVTRFVLEELRDKGGHWFWALQAITGANPAQFGDSFNAVRDAWIGWGKRDGYLKD